MLAIKKQFKYLDPSKIFLFVLGEYYSIKPMLETFLAVKLTFAVFSLNILQIDYYISVLIFIIPFTNKEGKTVVINMRQSENV